LLRGGKRGVSLTKLSGLLVFLRRFVVAAAAAPNHQSGRCPLLRFGRESSINRAYYIKNTQFGVNSALDITESSGAALTLKGYSEITRGIVSRLQIAARNNVATGNRLNRISIMLEYSSVL